MDISELDKKIEECRQDYRRAIADMERMCGEELEWLENPDYDELSEALDEGAFLIIQQSNKLRSLLELRRQLAP